MKKFITRLTRSQFTLLFFIFLMVLVIFFQQKKIKMLSNQIENLEENQQSLIEETGNHFQHTEEKMLETQEKNQKITGSLNEVRERLFLPPLETSLTNKPNEEIDPSDEALEEKNGEEQGALETSPQKAQTNFLLTGKHGNLVDTIMIANINEEKKKITLISIPRDLFVRGRKINSLYYYYGMEELDRQLENIFGIQIQNYILVDMYAFIDIIDIIGGLDIHLDKELYDPTYVTYDNGKWGRLYFPPGDHHLNGKQALRIARSRHTSSDFDRAARQQLIISALVKQGKSLSIKEGGKILDLAKVVFEKVQTDFTLQDLLLNYFRYSTYQISQKNVISTGNILYSTKSSAGAYILLPRYNNWNLFKTYFLEKIG